MRIGLALDDRRNEKRVALRPEELMDIARRCQVFVERDAGLGAGITDDEYRQAGAHPATKAMVYSCPLVVKLREPNETELKLMRPGATMFSMMHLHNRLNLARLLWGMRINAIAMEKVKDHLGERMIEDLHEVGYAGMMKAFELWGRSPAKATVKIMGHGKIAIGAIQAASRAQARVILFNKREMNEPHYLVAGIYHTALWGWPAMDPFHISKRYSLQLAPLVKALADNGLEKAPVCIQNAVIRLDAGERVL
ncbi:MAG: hypothetical protein COT18_04780 [Elusimicrobia bacterium CG08_land_8_20_14_0_20_59_10]|nr:MAG: hypothetical protein COT18_04780 [Elusimicrobia bacterium CG08_land_8_20_14_0_20_59_10]